MRKIEASAKTVEEAIEQGLQQLGVAIGDVDVQVVEEGSKGLFGLFGSRLAKVCLTVKETVADPLSDLMLEEEAPAKPEKKAEAPKAPKAPQPKPQAAKPAEAKPAQEKPAEAKPAEKIPAPKKPAEKKAELGKPVARKAPEPVKAEAAGEEETTETAKEIFRMEKPEVTWIEADQLSEETPAGEAHAFLVQLTKLMGVDVTIQMGTDAEGNVYGRMEGDTLGILIGRRGETLDAVQYLTSLKVNKGKENYTRITLDTENYRARREDTLIRLANRMANRTVRTARKVNLEPMNPYERRIIHFALQKNEGVETHSEGEEPNRHVVITPVRKK